MTATWNQEDSAAAQSQGWDLFEASSNGEIVSLIERCDEAGIFVDDFEAIAHVRKQADAGDAVAKKALVMDAELSAIAKFKIEVEARTGMPASDVALQMATSYFTNGHSMIEVLDAMFPVPVAAVIETVNERRAYQALAGRL